MRLGKFKQTATLRAGWLPLAMLALSSCASLSTRLPAGRATTQPLAEMHVRPEPGASNATALVIAGEFALQNNDAGEAEADYVEAAHRSDDPAVTRRALDLAFAQHDAKPVPGLIDRWQTLGATPRELAGARGRLAMLQGNRGRAEAEFDILLNGADADDWRAFGGALLSARDTALAGAILERMAKPSRLPAEEKLWVSLSQLGEHLGRHGFARTLADGAVRRFGGVDSLRWDASLKLEAGDRAGAEALYARGVRMHPRNTTLRLGYAALLGKQGKFRTALRVLGEGPQNDDTWSARVAFAARAKDKQAMARLYRELQRAQSGQGGGNAFLLGQLAELTGHDGQALHWYGQVDPDDDHAFDARLRSAILLDKAGRHARAHEIVQRLQQDYADDPESLRAAYELDAQLYARQGDHAHAIAVYDRGLDTLPDDPTLTYDRGIEEADAGDIDAALADFKRVLTANPGNVDAMNALGFTLADASRHLDEAARLLRKALAAKPGEAAIMDSWGWLQYRLGHLGQAENYLRRAWGKLEDPDIGAHLGEVLWKLGKHRQARHVFARVRTLDPHNATLQSALKRLRP
jgi:tetratricopeptide (TPR) repeat protein